MNEYSPDEKNAISFLMGSDDQPSENEARSSLARILLDSDKPVHFMVRLMLAMVFFPDREPPDLQGCSGALAAMKRKRAVLKNWNQGHSEVSLHNEIVDAVYDLREQGMSLDKACEQAAADFKLSYDHIKTTWRERAPHFFGMSLQEITTRVDNAHLINAAHAVAAHPEKSDRDIAAEIGVSDKTVAKARQHPDLALLTPARRMPQRAK